jgi:phage terminase small subunit
MSTSPPVVIETETTDAIEEEIVPKTMKTKAELLVRKMKADPDIAWSEKGELKYKEETVRGRNVVDCCSTGGFGRP